MSGKVTPAILGKGCGFPGKGPLPIFLTFIISLATVMVPGGASFSLQMCYTMSL